MTARDMIPVSYTHLPSGRDGLHNGANGLCVVALDKVVHLGQDDRQIAQFLRAHEAGEDIRCV